VWGVPFEFRFTIFFFFFVRHLGFFFYYYFYYHYHYYFQYRWENTAKPVSRHPVMGTCMYIGTTSQKLKTRVSHFYRPGQSEIYCSWTDQRHSYAFSIVSKPWCGLCPSRGDCTGRQNAKDCSELFFSSGFFFSFPTLYRGSPNTYAQNSHSCFPLRSRRSFRLPLVCAIGLSIRTSIEVYIYIFIIYDRNFIPDLMYAAALTNSSTIAPLPKWVTFF